MKQLSEHMLSHGDVSSALRSMMQRGVKGRQGQQISGIQDLLQRLREKRRQALDRYDIDSGLKDIRDRLDEIERLERKGIDKRLREVQERFHQHLNQREAAQGNEEQLLKMMERMTAQNKEFLDNLPNDPARKINALRDYEFMGAEARAKFDELLESLQEKVLDRYFQDLSQHIKGLTPQDLAGIKQMLQDLNEMLEQRIRGEQPDFQRFMDKHASHFGPEPPSNLDQLIEQMKEQMSMMESLLRNMSPSMRRQLQETLESVLQDQGLQEEMSQLAANLEYLDPTSPSYPEFSFRGDESLTLDQAIQLMKELQRMDELEQQLRRSQHDSRLQELDTRLVEEVMGNEALQDLERLRSLVKILEDSGYIRKVGSRFELTPKGMRNIGQKALLEIFAYIKRDRQGTHATRLIGGIGEQTEETKKYQYGDPFIPHIQKSLMNAIIRGSPGTPVRIRPEDFEVHNTEQLMQASTVLMIDLSLSMAMRGNFLAAKKVALALDILIRTRFPRDALYIVGFSTYAQEVKSEKLPYLSWDEFDPYTNIQQGLALAQKLLTRVSGGTKQIIMISDGEPTAHIESGQLFLQYPPSPRTIRETLKEVKRCTSKGIVINTFMLDRSAYLVEFVGQMTRINRGRVFYTSPEHLGQYILVDYFANRRKVLL